MTDTTITLPRSVVEQALDALQDADTMMEHRQDLELRHSAMAALRGALEQTDIGNPVSEPAGWKLVPVKLTDDMQAAGEAAWAESYSQHKNAILHVYRALLAAAPMPPTVKDSLTAQPQVEQEPVAWIENIGGGIGYNPYHDAARKLPDGVRFDLYVHSQNLNCKSNQARLATLWGYEKPQPPRQPLTDEEIERNWQFMHDEEGNPPDQHDFARAIERAHGIGGEA